MKTLFFSSLLLLLFLTACESAEPLVTIPVDVMPVESTPSFPAEYHGAATADIVVRQMTVNFTDLGFSQEMEVDEVNGRLFIEGDILIADTDTLPNRSASVSSDRKYWSGGRIPFEIEEGHPARQVILNSIAEISARTNLCVIPRTNERDFIRFVDAGGCWSALGRKRGGQYVSISNGCGFGTVIHEIMHAAGFIHEHVRPDRDDYITINEDNIQRGKKSNFKKYGLLTPVQTLGSYDFGSIMHYGAYAFSKDQNRKTIAVHPDYAGSATLVGQRNGLSQKDINGINAVYQNGSSCVPTNTWLVAWGGTSNWTPLNSSGFGVDELLVGDFDGDGTDDLFRGSGSNWYVSYGGISPWTIINGSDYQTKDLLIGYFDADAKADVLLADGNNWRISYGGNTNWQVVNGSNYRKRDLLIGDFTGDGLDDVLLADGNNWRISASANTNWRIINGSNYPKGRLLVGNFNGDTTDDILLTDGSDWRVSDNGNTNWRVINGSDYQIDRLLVGKFDAGTTDDVLLADGSTWRVSDNANTNWRTIHGSDYTKPHLLLGDFNGDGITDVLRHFGN